MSSSNRTQVVSVIETTVGTTPNTPRMRARRTSGEGLKWVPTFVDSGELRSDGMNAPPIKTGEDSSGDIKLEFSYPMPNSPADVDISSVMRNPWSNTNSRDNDGVADSVITAVATSGTILTVTTGTAFVAGELYRFTDFGVAGNNGVFKCTTGSATVPVFAGSGITDEAVPPAAARVKCVGFQGASGDITATASGLASTALDFTTIPGIAAGKWIKPDSTTAAMGFATAANNDWIWITAVTAHAITCSNLPSGWAVDAGTSKTIKVYFGDQIKNGTTLIAQSIEKGFLGQTVPTYILQPGCAATQYTMNWTAKQKITGATTYMGMTGASQGTVAQDASPDATTSLTSYPVMACGPNVGRVGEAGSTLAAPNFVKSLTLQLDNTITPIEAVHTVGAAGLTAHSFKASGTLETYFGDNSLLTKFFAGTLTSLNVRVVGNSRAVILTLPQITYNANGSPNAGGMDQDVMLPLGWKASKEETVTNAMALFDRFEFYA
jgi:hypothetical protein